MSHEGMGKALEYFEHEQIDHLLEVFEDLKTMPINGEVATNHAIDQHTFMNYFSYPGVLSTQIFKVFDRNNDGFIDSQEFVSGLALVAHGDLSEKLKFLFSMLDLSGDGFVDREELTSILSSTAIASFRLLEAVAVEQGYMQESDCLKPSEFSNEVADMVETAFHSDENDDGKLSIDEFKQWLVTTPEVIGIVYSVFEMRGHADVSQVIKQFEDAKELFSEANRSAKSKQREAEAVAAKLVSENSVLLARLEQLESRVKELERTLLNSVKRQEVMKIGKNPK